MINFIFILYLKKMVMNKFENYNIFLNKSEISLLSFSSLSSSIYSLFNYFKLPSNHFKYSQTFSWKLTSNEFIKFFNLKIGDYITSNPFYFNLLNGFNLKLLKYPYS